MLAEEVARRAADHQQRPTLSAAAGGDRRRTVSGHAGPRACNPLAPLRAGWPFWRWATPARPSRETRDIMERQVEHLVRLVDDLLDVSASCFPTRSTAARDHRIPEVISRAVETTRRTWKNGGTRCVRLPSQPVHLRGDRIRLAQVFSNLLHNAARIPIPAGGSNRMPNSMAVRRAGSPCGWSIRNWPGDGDDRRISRCSCSCQSCTV